MLYDMVTIAQRIALIPAIKHSHWNLETWFYSEYIPAFCIGKVVRRWRKLDGHAGGTQPVYHRVTTYTCCIIHDIHQNNDDFDTINADVVKEIRLLIEGCFLMGKKNYTIGNFSIVREEIDEIDARIMFFDVILEDLKDYLRC